MDHEAIIVGAGFSGIGAALRLDRAGIHDYLVLEEGGGVGGAWYWNTYPGIAVDIPSFSYQFSFEKNPNWSRVYAPGAELKDYAEHCVAKYRLASRIRLNTKVLGARYDDDLDLWRVNAAGEEITARYLISATGLLSKPRMPDIDGIGDFAGTVIHTARWDHNADLTGKRVAVIGTGASGLQVIPEIADTAGKLTVFQRTPIWCLPKIDVRLPVPLRSLLRVKPFATAARLFGHAIAEIQFPLLVHYNGVLPISTLGQAISKAQLRWQVRDPRVRAKLRPDYTLGCKRPSISNTYLATFNRPNVALETAPIETVTAHGVRTADGVSHPIDILVLATGFKTWDPENMPAFPVHGSDGVELGGWWKVNRHQAYEGVSVPGFPNYFMIFGPYGYNGTSYFQLIETQMRHIVRCLARARRTGSTRIEVKPEANERYFRTMLQRQGKQVFQHGDCTGARSYYYDANGDIPFRPTTSLETAWRSVTFDLDDYTFAAPA
ncbi:flavin-containing monooxygenase [Nocardia sp. NPDC052566]|uniref:flavin-containing monooxygenase n=1 Tax=Nocardia sp. NPDC052566 TaxID=3364330 RepID=UPI0037CC368A